MSKSSGSKTQPSVSTVSNGIPGWVEDAGKSNWKLAQSIASRPFNPGPTNTVAGFNADQDAALEAVRALQGTGAAGMRPAMDLATQVGAADAPTVRAGSFLEGDIQKYMDPFLAQVEEGAMSNLDRQRVLALTQTGDQAASAGAFGGSRHGVVEGVTNAEAARSAGQLSSQIRSAAYSDAAGRLTGDIDRRFDADKTNAAAFLDTMRNRLQASELLGNQATAGHNMTAQEIALLDAAGGQRQAVEQARLDANLAEFNRRNNYATDMLNLRISALSGTPYTKTQTTSTPVTKSSPWLGALGGAAQGAGIAQALGATTGWGAALTGAGGLLGGLSEDTEKTDVKRLGKDPDTGLEMYAYRYKGDPKSYPKVVGPMASEIEHKVPGGVKRVGGKRVVTGAGLPVMARAVRPAGLLEA